MKSELRVQLLQDQTWRLFAQRAAYWENERLLIVADVHFGKAACFRARGVPIPHGTTSENTQRLSALIAATRPRALVFLGDLFHARESHAAATLDALRIWRRAHRELDMLLVEGNHDLHAGPPPAELGIGLLQEPWHIGAFALCHHPQRVPDAHVLAGHLHPALRITGRSDAVRVPCFWLQAGLSVLPAFGEFTGAASIRPQPGDRVIAAAGGCVFELPVLPAAAA